MTHLKPLPAKPARPETAQPKAPHAIAPPPTRYGPAAPAQPKTAPPWKVQAAAPPPTRYGAPSKVQRKVAGVVQRAAPAGVNLPQPSTTIDWDTLAQAGVDDHGLVLDDRESGTFLGKAGGGYPHFHVWRNGKIALSVAHNSNYKIGEDGVVDIAEIGIALERGVAAGPVKSLLQWVMSSAQ